MLENIQNMSEKRSEMLRNSLGGSGKPGFRFLARGLEGPYGSTHTQNERGGGRVEGLEFKGQGFRV